MLGGTILIEESKPGLEGGGLQVSQGKQESSSSQRPLALIYLVSGVLGVCEIPTSIPDEFLHPASAYDCLCHRGTSLCPLLLAVSPCHPSPQHDKLYYCWTSG